MIFRNIIIGILIRNLILISAEDCELTDNCRLVDINGDDKWANITGHYKTIQECIDDAVSGDTCLVRSGIYHEEVLISEKNNIALRGDLDYDRPVIDGTVELTPIKEYDSNADGVGDGNWKEELIDGNTVCIGEIEVIDEKHPFQLFLMKDGEREMMTNARWPNAVWSDKDPETGTPLVFYNKYWGKSDGSSTRGKMVDRNENGVSPLAASGLDVSDAMAVLNVGSWCTFVKPVINHTAGDRFFTYDDDFGNIHFKAGNNQYYLDSAESLLDNPGEWYYNMKTKTLKFMPWDGECPKPDSGKVRGRTIDYAITVAKTDGLIISDLDFFASNVHAESKPINELYLDSLNFMYPASSKRMLQDYNVPKFTKINGQSSGTIHVTNCVFFGGESVALYFYGKNAKIHNNLFKWNDWSGQMSLYSNGGFGTVWGENHGTNEEFSGNTLYYNGGSAGYRPGGNGPRTLDNLVVGQCIGKIMNDGAGMQFQTGAQPNSFISGNWVFDTPKYGIRFDCSGSSLNGHDATIYKNVVWRTAQIMVKGDHHNVTGNLCVDHKDSGNPILTVIHCLRSDPLVHNNHTVVENNAAYISDGGINQVHGGGRWPLFGNRLNNYYANWSWHGSDGWDHSWVLNGTTIFPEEKLIDLLMDAHEYDFRPKVGTVLTSLGVQIGPYPEAYSSDVTKYNIPGRKEYKASHPIPHHTANATIRDALMFRPAFRCDGEKDRHLAYICKENEEFPPIDQPTAEMYGDDNMINFSQIDLSINTGETYKWRVDCLEGTTSKRRYGDEWTFMLHE